MAGVNRLFSRNISNRAFVITQCSISRKVNIEILKALGIEILKTLSARSIEK